MRQNAGTQPQKEGISKSMNRRKNEEEEADKRKKEDFILKNTNMPQTTRYWLAEDLALNPLKCLKSGYEIGILDK